MLNKLIIKITEEKLTFRTLWAESTSYNFQLLFELVLNFFFNAIKPRQNISGYGLFLKSNYLLGDSPVAQMMKNLPAMQEAEVQSLDWEDPLLLLDCCNEMP